ncbi:MAG: hypothetical protein FJZ90_04585 [Chloroflexi bacterium]|nr:hypothetical protein [Chloroflexota bacterium]
MRSIDLRVDGLSVRLNTLRGDAISFGWDEPLLVNGAEIPLGGFPHYDTPYCQVALGDSAMTLELGARPLRLDFS